MNWQTRGVRSALLIALFAFLVALVPISSARARPGGGHTYSGGGSSGGRSSGSSHGSSGHSGSASSSRQYGSSSVDTDPPRALFWALFLGLFGVCGLALVFAAFQARSERRDAWETAQWRAQAAEAEARAPKPLDDLRARDPAFSLALFEDFAGALFARAQEARHDPAALARLAPYLDAAVRADLRRREPVGVPVTTVVIGAMKTLDWRLDEVAGRFRVNLRFEADLIMADQTQHVDETWMLQRSPRAITRTWEGTRTFGCPSCGAPFERVAEELCESCGQRVSSGRFDWCAARIEKALVGVRASSFAGTVAEQGTDRPTVIDARLAEEKARLTRDDPEALTGIEPRLRLIFDELNAAWAAQDLRPCRAYLSSGLHTTLAQQVEAYRAQGLVNRVEGARIVRFETVKILREGKSECVTLRVFGNGRDVTLSRVTGEVVGGSRDADRPYSEYWTLMRGVQVRGAGRTDKRCPACSAPLAVGMEGNCEHCGALVASGDFDWVLSRIEQDDSYTG